MAASTVDVTVDVLHLDEVRDVIARAERVQTLHRADRQLITQLFGTVGKLTEQVWSQRQALRRIADGVADPAAIARGAL